MSFCLNVLKKNDGEIQKSNRTKVSIFMVFHVEMNDIGHIKIIQNKKSFSWFSWNHKKRTCLPFAQSHWFAVLKFGLLHIQFGCQHCRIMLWAYFLLSTVSTVWVSNFHTYLWFWSSWIVCTFVWHICLAHVAYLAYLHIQDGCQ